MDLKRKANPDDETPRPEHPRPDFRRDNWFNLNGWWEFEFDDSGRGMKQGWYDGRELEKRILVPFAYQTEASGINDKGVHPIVWYARTIEFDPTWNGKDLLLHFGAVDYSCTVYMNGVEVGHNEGGHVPFQLDIAPYCRPGANRLTLRVVDELDPYQPRGKQSSTGIPHGIDYYCTTGIWQTVWLEPVSPMRIDAVKITPVLQEGAFELRVFLHAPSAEWTIEAQVFDHEECVTQMQREIHGAYARFFLRIPDARIWSPDTPNLYDIVVRLRGEGRAIVDEVNTYGGIRSVGVRKGAMELNEEPIYLKMVLDQGYWPESYMTAPSDDALRQDVELAKSLGFNGIRKHQKVEDPRWLYWCDRFGVLVWGEMANSRAWSSDTEEKLTAEWMRAVERDFNHPCIAAWVPVNESMGFPDLEIGHPGQYAFVEGIVNATRVLDPHRPIIDNDGWEHTDITDVIAIHDYTPTSEGLKKRYEHTLRGGPLPAKTWIEKKPIFTRGSRHWSQPVMLTEVGGFLFVPPNASEEDLDELYKYYGQVRSYQELLDKFDDLMRGIAALPFVSGFCYTQLVDVEQELNGLATYNRRLKVPAENVKAILDTVFADHKFAVVGTKTPDQVQTTSIASELRSVSGGR